MSLTSTILLLVFIGYPIWRWLQSETEARLRGQGVKLNGQRRKAGVPPPDPKLPPLVGNVVERKVVRKLLP